MAKIGLYFLSSFVGALLSLLLMLLFIRPLLKMVTKRMVNIIMRDRYVENVWEMVTAVTRMSPIKVVENSLRAETGGVIERPFGSPRKFLNFDGLIFSAAQLTVLPAHEDAQVNTAVTIGPCAKKPLTLEIPILLGGMGYGVGMSEPAKMAMAIGTAAVGTATNIGEGGFLQEERDRSKFMIMQYHTGKWVKKEEELKQADAIEIHLGQGASAAAASRIPPEYMQGKARDVLGLEPDETAVLSSRYPNLNRPEDLREMVQELREITDGVPIGIKMIAGKYVENDIEAALKAQVDFISLDGGQAGTKGSPPILEDDFGLPTIYALSRAVQYLKQRGMTGKVSLLIGGGFFTPNEFLKALALGADAVYIGTAAIWAMSHTQVSKTLPFEPPTHLVFYPGDWVDDFDQEEAAKNLENFFNSCVEEMRVATLAMGKTDINSVNVDDLIALDEFTSQVTQVPVSYGKRVKEQQHHGDQEIEAYYSQQQKDQSEQAEHRVLRKAKKLRGTNVGIKKIGLRIPDQPAGE